MKRVIFHAINHVGLGHLFRTLSIARWLSNSISEVEILFLVENESQLLVNETFPWIKLPSIYDFQSDVWQKVPEKTRNSLVTGLVGGIIDKFQPSIFIYDSVIWYPILQATQQSDCKQILIARMGQLTRNLLEKDEIIARINKIIVPHYMDEIRRDQPLFNKFPDKVIVSGPILRKSLNEINVSGIKAKYNLSDQHFNIIVTAGGGGWKQTQWFFECLISAIEILGNTSPAEEIRVIIITGPFYQNEISYIPSNMRIFKFIPDLMDLMAAANLVICQAGSTLNEIAEIGVPALCIPTPEADDQLDRANFFSTNFINIIQSELNIDIVVKNILTFKQDKRFVFTPPLFPNDNFVKTHNTIIKSILNLL